MSPVSVQCAQLSGIGAESVVAEIDISTGIYAFQIVGLAHKSVEESKERVVGALKNGLRINPKTLHHKITVSLSPAELQKEGAYFDVAIAIAYLKATNTITSTIENKLFIGELSLSGEVKKVKGVIPILLWAQKNNITALFLSKESETEIASLAHIVPCFLVGTLQEIVDHLENKSVLQRYVYTHSTQKEEGVYYIDQIKGQQHAKRALTIAATGNHNIVLYGPPGTGKTMLAKAFHELLPNLSTKQFLEVASIYSSVGKYADIINQRPPFRSPHHSASSVAIIGGASTIKPGDITLAHHGILFLDEFPEFDKKVIEALREPLEDKTITVSRAKGSITYPASCIVIATMNPCPCGYRGSTTTECTCTATDINKYNKKLSGPIIDRMDLWVPVTSIHYEDLHNSNSVEQGSTIRKTITETRLYQKELRGKTNSELSSADIFSLPLTQEAKTLLQLSAKKLSLSPRVYTKIIKIAQTISDIERASIITPSHILEALQYRPKNHT